MGADVIVVGAGPVGLFLACELQLAGANPVLLEQLPEVRLQDKAHGLAGQVVRLLDHRGLFERCGGRGIPEPVPSFFFGGMTLPLAELGADNPMYVLPIAQRELERVLNERAAELGVDIRRGWEVTGFEQDDERVRVEAKGPGGERSEWAAPYAVGCDGGHSFMRKHAGIEFPGIVNPHVVVRSAIVARVDDLDAALSFGGEAGFLRTERGVVSVGAFNAERPVVNTIEWETHPAGSWPGPGDPMSLAEMADSLERVLGRRVALSPPPPGGPELLRRLCGRNTRLAEHYRAGRVFLAGDAAHVHAAAGGPGLNLALQDAANLAWKLATAVGGRAPSGLLNSYEAERRAVGSRVFMQTQAQTALYAPEGDVTALRQLFGELLDRRENLHAVAALMAGSDVRFDMGVGESDSPTGWFVPELRLETPDGPRRVAELMRDARPLLIDVGAHLATDVAPWGDRIRRVAVEPSTELSMLVRPDGYVAWTSGDPASLVEALRRWFGPVDDAVSGRTLAS